MGGSAGHGDVARCCLDVLLYKLTGCRLMPPRPYGGGDRSAGHGDATWMYYS